MSVSTESNFYKWVLPEISEIVPAFEGNFNSFDLTKDMTDSEIRAEKGMDVLTPDEWAAKTSFLILEQKNRGRRHLAHDNVKSNIDYVQLRSGRVVVVRVHYPSSVCGWSFGARRLGGYFGYWIDGDRVFMYI